MNRSELKERYEQFKRWQRQPAKFVNSDEEHRCYCCGTTYSGNFCPCCSQKSVIGPINWKSVRQGVMDIWGLGTRSLLYSIWQLLFRPGYFINDYISGKRQVSFPPVKMLFIVTVIYSLVVYWLLSNFLGVDVGEFNGENRKLMSEYYNWYVAHYSWVMLIMAILAIFPTWIMFRYAPRHTRHTLPEGFFIQVFLSVLMVSMNFLLIPVGLIYNKALNVIITLITMFYYVVTYRQLFGYGLWGTFWRQAVVLSVISLCEMGLIIGIFGVDFGYEMNSNLNADQLTLLRYGSAVGCVFLALVLLAIGYIINLIATREDRRQLPPSFKP